MSSILQETNIKSWFCHFELSNYNFSFKIKMEVFPFILLCNFKTEIKYIISLNFYNIKESFYINKIRQNINLCSFYVKVPC